MAQGHISLSLLDPHPREVQSCHVYMRSHPLLSAWVGVQCCLVAYSASQKLRAMHCLTQTSSMGTARIKDGQDACLFTPVQSACVVHNVGACQ
jgi:hypothetical protein